MWRACSRCGKIHNSKFKCNAGKIYFGGDERKMRSAYAWTKKAEEIKQRAGWLCEVCRDHGKYTYDGLEVHHIVKVREDPDGLLANGNLVCLCVAHHKEADAGRISADYLRLLAKKREER